MFGTSSYEALPPSPRNESESDSARVSDSLMRTQAGYRKVLRVLVVLSVTFNILLASVDGWLSLSLYHRIPWRGAQPIYSKL